MSYFKASPKLKASDLQLVISLRALQTFEDVANLLEITPKHLHYILFKKKISHQYKSFEIAKKRAVTARYVHHESR